MEMVHANETFRHSTGIAGGYEQFSFAHFGRHNMTIKSKNILVVALAVASVAWVLGVTLLPSGVCRVTSTAMNLREIEFGDYHIPRSVAANEHTYSRCDGYEIADVDRCYSPLSYDLIRVFPEDDIVGGATFMLFSGMALWCSIFIFMRWYECGILYSLVFASVAVLSHPVVTAMASGQMVVLSVVGVILWAAWRNAKSAWLRGVAVVALAFAATLKIVPAVFAVYYLKNRQFREFTLFIIVAAVLFFVPFAWHGGVEGFCAWFANARANAVFYESKGAWGIVPIDRAIRIMGGMSACDTFYWPTLKISRVVNVVAGLACLVAAWRSGSSSRNDGGDGATLLLLCGAMLLIPGNMLFYTGVYLLVPFVERWKCGEKEVRNDGVVERWSNLLAALCWFWILCPIQFSFGAGGLNRPFANFALMGLLAMSFWKGCRWRS